MPFCTEEVWSWWQEGSILHAAWPTAGELAVEGDAALLDDVAVALAAVRGAKSSAKVSMKTEVACAELSGPAATLDRLRPVEPDLRAVGRITGDVVWTPAAAPLAVAVVLVPAEG